MRKNYPDLSNNNFFEVLSLRAKLTKLFLFLGLMMLALNSYGQNNAAAPIPLVSVNSGDLSTSTTSLLGVSNLGRLVDNDLDNYASITTLLGIGVSRDLKVTNNNKTYAAGTFAGFKIGPNSGVLSLDLLNGITIKTYNGANVQESFSGSSLLSLTLLSGSNDRVIGFNTNKPFNAIELVYKSTVSLLSTTRIYYAVIKEYSAGPALDCNTATKLSFPTYPVTINPANTGVTGVTVGSVSDVENAISTDANDYATINLTVSVAGSGSIAIKDQVTNYPVGTYAGFEIENTGLLSVAAIGNVVVKTYLDGVEKESFSGTNLVANVGLLPVSGRFKLGFVSTKVFNEIKLTVNQTVGLNLGTTRVYGAVFQEFCEAKLPLECNTKTALTSPTYPVYINNVNSGIDGLVCALCTIVNQDNVIDANPNNYAEVNLSVGLGTRGSLSVKEQITDYPAGTFAGYTIENPALLTVGALDAVRVTTYLNGAEQETRTGNGPLIAVATDLLGGSGKQTVGFVATKSFDEVKITFENLLKVNLGLVKVYNVVLEKFCEGAALECNTKTALTSPAYPIYVNSVNSGVDGLVCVGCTIVDQDNLIDADATNYATVNLLAAVGAPASLSVKEQITDYPAGTFAGYTIENPNLLSVDAFSAITITTYLNGAKQETKTGNGPLVAVATDLLVGTSKQTIGFVSTKAFDEVQITFQNLVSVNLGIVKVYSAVFQKLCDPVVECDKSYVWSNPAFPVTIDGDKTGLNGVACVGCAVKGTDNLLTESKTDFANITLIANVLGSGSVAVKDQLFTYPKGTFAGFVIKDLGTLAQVNLLQSLTINTYNNGVLQESRTAAQLIDLSLLGIDVLGSVPGVYNVGFKTALPFDEIQLTLSSVASVINSINIYGAFINTSESDGDSGSGLDCQGESTITVTKDGTYVDANADRIVNVGDRIDYVFDITNTGPKALKNITITDNNPTVTVTGSPIASLAAGANNTTAYTATYTITQADLDAGVVYNLATVNAETNLGTKITATSTDPTPCTDPVLCPPNPNCTDCTITPIGQINTIALVKTAVVGGTGILGNVITYTFAVTNTGNTTLTNVKVTDPMLGLVIQGSPIASLAPGATTSIKGIYIITQADVNKGKVINSALVTAKNPQNKEVTDRSGTTIATDDSTETPVTQTSKIALVKTASVEGDGSEGKKISYTFAVTNIGTTTLTNIVVTDPMLGLTTPLNTITSLAPGATNISIKETYVITAADVAIGKVTNSALVTAKDPQNNDVTDISGTTIATDDDTETPVGQRSTIALVKTGVLVGTGVSGDEITYTFTVTNTGTKPLTDIVVTDPMIGTITNPIATFSLASGASISITEAYTITQADVDAGKVTNSAEVTAKDPDNKVVKDTSGTTIGTDDSTVTEVTQSPSITLVKEGVTGGAAGLGDTITYSFTVKNTGNTTLTNIVVTDPMTGLTMPVNTIASLAPSADTTITGTYKITQADVDAGKVVNTATVIGRSPLGKDVDATSTKTITTVPKSASIAFVKTGVYKGDAKKAKVGDIITYTFRVTNTGNVTVKDIVINDAKLGTSNLALVPATLAPTKSGVITKDYLITQADIDAGKVTNTAIAKGQDPQGVDVTDTSGTAIDNNVETVTTLPKLASIAFVKTGTYNGDATNAKVGDKITYTFTVTNTGNVTVKDIKIKDAKLGTTDFAVNPATLAPTKLGVITKEYTITQADIDAGQVTNTATATGKDPDNIALTAVSSTVTTLPRLPASLGFVKTGEYKGDATKAKVGDIITYTFRVTNTGNLTVKDIVINDAKLGTSNLALVPPTLAPTESGVITKEYAITQDDIDLGKVTNTATATGKDPQGVEVKDISGTAVDNDDNTITTLPKSASLGFVKTGQYKGDATKAKVGDIITYTFTVTNTGNVTVENIVINDTKLGTNNLALVPSTLAPSAIGIVTQDYVVTQADIDTKKVTNTATAIGQDPQGNDVEDTSGTAIDNDETTITDFPENAKIALILKGEFQDENNDGQAQIGETILYSYTIMNIGDVPLSKVWIEDAMAGLGMSSGTINMAAGTTDNTSFTASYSITQADIIAGYVTNQAKVFGTSPLGVVVQDLSHDTSPLEDGSTVIDVDGCVIKVFNAVAPNAAGENKILYIRGLDCYPDNTVQIFDRWGVKVYDVNGYDNNAKAFRGISEGRVTISQSKGLPNGTYFYVINYVDKEGKGFNKSGYLHLIND